MSPDTLDLLMFAFAFPVAAILVLYGIEDMTLDLAYYLGGFKATRRCLSLAELRGAPRKRIAMMVPAWHEAAVIDRMLESSMTTLEYDPDKLDIFVGTYPNDPETRAKVASVARRIPSVHECVVPHDGPTSKADALNTIWRCIQEYERATGARFEVLLMHDSEDVIHPLALLQYNYWIPTYDFVQTPVLPLEIPLWELVAGTYMDEFAEYHLKDMIMRGHLRGFVPSAGVGSAFARGSFEEVARAHADQPFDVESLTEDYEVGLKMRLAGKSTHFACDWVELERTVGGRPTKVRELIATREYFPTGLRASIRQRSRWICGIGFQAWDRIGWKGPIPVLYSLYRDRRALVSHSVALAAYMLLFYCLGRWGIGLATGHPWAFTRVFVPGTVLSGLVVVNAAFAAWRASVKVATLRRVYPWGLSLMSVVRWPLANFIGFAATLSAARQYLVHVITKKPLRWKKTDHVFPTAAAARAPVAPRRDTPMSTRPSASA
jgi:adsorption protein B